MSVILIIGLPLLFGWLYFMGWLPVSVKRAVLFSGNMGKQHCSASFTACHGRIFRVIRFRESRSCSFSLTGHIRRGSVTATVQDIHGTPLLTLTDVTPTGILPAQAARRCILVLRFDHADGDFRLDWE